MQQPTIAAGIVAGFVAFLASRGAEANQLAGQAGIDPRDLDNPDARILSTPFETLLPAKLTVSLREAARGV